MNERTIHIIDDLSTNKYTLCCLADKYNVTVRTIRNDVKEINELLVGNNLQRLKIEKDGLIRVAPNFSICKQFIDLSDFYIYKLSRNERIVITSLIFIFNPDDYITISQIAERLYTSRTTITKDLPKLRSFLAEFALNLQTHPNKGTKIKNTEKEKRTALLKLYLSSSGLDHFNVFEAFIKHKVISHNHKKIVANIITEIEHEYQIKFTEDSFKLLNFYLNILIEKINRKSPILNFEKY